VAAAPTGVRAGPGTASATAPYPARPGDRGAKARARLADGAGRAHRVTGIVGTMGVGGTTLAAVCFRAPAPQEPPLMVIISVVSCRVQENGASVPGRARNRMPGSAAIARYRTCRPWLRRERALHSEDRPRFMRLAMNEPRP
jgi:hypothetical protein